MDVVGRIPPAPKGRQLPKPHAVPGEQAVDQKAHNRPAQPKGQRGAKDPQQRPAVGPLPPMFRQGQPAFPKPPADQQGGKPRRSRRGKQLPKQQHKLPSAPIIARFRPLWQIFLSFFSLLTLTSRSKNVTIWLQTLQPICNLYEEDPHGGQERISPDLQRPSPAPQG